MSLVLACLPGLVKRRSSKDEDLHSFVRRYLASSANYVSSRNRCQLQFVYMSSKGQDYVITLTSSKRCRDSWIQVDIVPRGNYVTTSDFIEKLIESIEEKYMSPRFEDCFPTPVRYTKGGIMMQYSFTMDVY